MLHLGLENDPDALQMESPRPRLRGRNLASPRNLEIGHGRLGWSGETLGLNKCIHTA